MGSTKTPCKSKKSLVGHDWSPSPPRFPHERPTRMFARQLNPVETQAYEAQFMTLPPEHQADVAMVWRERCIDVLSEMVNPGSALIGAFVGASYGALLGAWSGRGEAEAFALTEEWKAAGAASKGIDPADHPTPFKTITDKSGNVIHERVGDPRKFGGLPRGGWATIVSGIGSMATTPYFRVSRTLRDMTNSGVGFLAGSAMSEWAFNSHLDKMAQGGANA